MSKYSQVKHYTLKNEVNKALNELNTHKLEPVRDIIDVRFLNTNCRLKILNMRNNILNSESLNGSIKNLEKNLNNLKNVVDYIATCDGLECDISNLETLLYDEEGNINKEVENKINDKKISLASYEEKIDNLL